MREWVRSFEAHRGDDTTNRIGLLIHFWGGHSKALVAELFFYQTASQVVSAYFPSAASAPSPPYTSCLV